MRLTRNKKTHYCSMVMLSQKVTLWYYSFTISISDLCPNLMRVQTGKVAHTHKELAYEKNNSIRA